MVASSQGKDSQSSTVFNTVIGKMTNADTLTVQEALFLEVRELGDTIQAYFTVRSEPYLLRDIKLSFYLSNGAELEGRIQVAFFHSVVKTYKIKILWKTLADFR